VLNKYAPDKFSVNVSDLARSVTFYGDVLGFRKLWEEGEHGNAGFRAGSNILILQQNPERVAHGGFRPHFTVDDLEGVREQLVAAGVDCSEITDFGSFEHVTLRDPDGNFIGLLRPKPDYLSTMEAYLGRRVMPVTEETR